MLFHAWNVAEVEDMALPPCHLLYQFYVSNPAGDGGKPRLSGLLTQRSVDVFLGCGFNICNFGLLLHMLAQQVDMVPGELVWVGGDTHLYLNHLDQAREQLSRSPRPFPKLKILRKPDSIDGYRIEDFVVEGYDPHPAIKADVAV
jgi:thymidylate synthase